MNRARIVVLTVAICAGGVAAYLASGTDNSAPPPLPVAQLPTVDVLVAKNDIGLGQTVKPEDVQWQTWPAATASTTFIRRNERPDAATQVSGSIARAPFIQGEPIRDQKLVKAEGSGFMAAILPTGMRAISTEISPETGAGGFILPNDRRRASHAPFEEPGREQRRPRPRHLRDHPGQYPRPGHRPGAQGEGWPERGDRQDRHPRAQSSADRNALRGAAGGTLSLALRSIADVKLSEITLDDSAQKRDGISIIRYGIPSQTAKAR